MNDQKKLLLKYAEKLMSGDIKDEEFDMSMGLDWDRINKEYVKINSNKGI